MFTKDDGDDGPYKEVCEDEDGNYSNSGVGEEA